MRVLIVDDEPLARRRLREMLAEAPDVEVVGECSDGEEAVAGILALRPDVVFLDIEMPEMDGFEVLRTLGPEQTPVVVFATAYDEYAMRAFDAHAVDYLLKPLERGRVESSLDRARAFVDRHTHPSFHARLQAVLASLEGPGSESPERIGVRVGQRIEFVRVADIDWVGAEANYVRLHVEKRSYVIRETLQQFSKRLDPKLFLRIHRSTLLNTKRIKAIQSIGRGSYTMVLQDGTKLTSGASFREAIEMLITGAA